MKDAYGHSNYSRRPGTGRDRHARTEVMATFVEQLARQLEREFGPCPARRDQLIEWVYLDGPTSEYPPL